MTGAGSDANFTAAMGIPTLDGARRTRRGNARRKRTRHHQQPAAPRALLASVLQNWEME
jgi:hypothetical protein